MKRLSLVLAAMLVLVMGTNCFAVEVEGDAYVGVYSKYLFKGFDYSDGKAVLQGGMDLSANGFTLSVWSNAQLSSTDNFDSGVNETDFYLDYTFSVGEITSVSLGNGHYTYNAPVTENEAYVGVAFDVLLAPEVYVTYAWDVPGEENGFFFTVSGSHGIELNEETALTLGALVSYNQQSYFAGDDTRAE